MRLLYAAPKIRGLVVRLQTVAFRLWCRGKVDVGPGLRVFGWPLTQFTPGSRVVVGTNVRLISSSSFNPIGLNHPCSLRTLSPSASLVIGNDVGMSGCTIVAADSVAIGNGCLLGANSLVMDTDIHPLETAGRRWRTDDVRSAPVALGDNVFVGTAAMILKGVTVGDNAVIGAGSVVSSDVPAEAIVGGSPARVIGSVG
jgi:acetyltransferase-like isoleucine patch superfamily enzyme